MQILMQNLGIHLQSSCQGWRWLPRRIHRGYMLTLGIINPALLPSPPASAFTSSILLTTFASPTLEYATTLPIVLIDVFLYCNTRIDACNKFFQTHLESSCDTLATESCIRIKFFTFAVDNYKSVSIQVKPKTII